MYQHDRFRYAMFVCKHLYYDIQRACYICDITGIGFKSSNRCRECSHLHVLIQAEPQVDMRYIQ